MIFTAIKSLAWEVLNKNKKSLIFALFLIPTVWLGIKSWMISMPAYADLHYLKLENMILLQTTLFLCLTFSYLLPSSRGISIGFPPHIFRLPIPTWLMALVPIVLGSVIITLFVLSWLLLISKYSLTITQQLMIWISVTAMMTWIQATIWGFFRAVVQKSMIVVGVLIALALSLQSILIEPIQLSIMGRLGGIISVVVLLITGYLLAFYSVARARYSEPGFSLPVAMYFNLFLKKLPFRRKIPIFKNAIEAQDWYEWQQHGWLMPAIISMLSVVVLLAVSTQKPNVEAVLMFFSVGPIYIVALMGGEYASTGLGSGKTEMTSFTATHPLSVYRLAMSKIRLIGKSLTISMVIAATTILIAILIMTEMTLIPKLEQLLVSRQGIAGALIVMALFFMFEFSFSWAIATTTASVALTANKKWQWILAVLTLVIFLSLITVGQKAYASPEYLQFLIDSAHLFIILPSLLIGGILSFFLVKFKNIEKLKELKFSLKVISLSLIFSLILLWQLSLSIAMLWALSWLFIDVALLSWLPFMAAPLAVHLNRSR